MLVLDNRDLMTHHEHGPAWSASVHFELSAPSFDHIFGASQKPVRVRLYMHQMEFLPHPLGW